MNYNAGFYQLLERLHELGPPGPNIQVIFNENVSKIDAESDEDSKAEI